MKSKITLFRFDLIRILAMVFVIGTHFNETFGSMGIRASCLHVYMGKGLLYSQMGVVLFILMSGSLSAASLERSLSDNGVLERKSVLRDYKKRLLSVLPLYYNDSAQKTPAVRKNVRGMNAPITNNATIIPTGFSSGIVGFSWPDVLQNAVIRCIALLFQEKHFR